MGSLFGSEEKTTTESKSSQKQRVVLPDYLKDVMPSIVNRAEQLSLQPYTPFTGQRFQDFTPEQQQAFQGVRQLQGQYQPAVDQSIQAAMGASQGLTQPQIEQFMNPYIENVVDIQKREALRDFDRQRNQIGDLAAQVGAFGGDRMGVLEGEAYRDIGQRLDDITQQGYAGAYDRATQTGLQNLQLRNQAAANVGNIASQAQGYNLRDLAALEQTGATQQRFGQAQRDFDYGQFMEKQQWPYRQLQFLSGTALPVGQLTAGQNVTGNSTQTQTAQTNPGIGQTALGIASMAAAPFTGGATLGGSIMSGLGSLFGGGGPTALNPGAVGVGFGSGAFMKEGGQVKKQHKYANGGSIFLENQGDPQKSPLQLMLEENIGGFGETFMDGLTRLGQRAARTGIRGYQYATQPEREFLENQTPVDPFIREFEERSMMEELAGRLESGQTQNYMNEMMGTVGPAADLNIEKEEQDQLGAVMSLIEKERGGNLRLNNIQEQEPRQQQPSQSSFEQQLLEMARPKQEEQERPLVNMDLLKFGARLLSNPRDTFGQALARGALGYAEDKSAQQQAKAKARENQLETTMDLMKLRNTGRFANIQEAQLAMSQRMQPFKMAKEAAEAQALRAKAQQDPMMSKALDRAIELKASDPSYMNVPLRDVLDEVLELSGSTPSIGQAGLNNVTQDIYFDKNSGQWRQ